MIDARKEMMSLSDEKYAEFAKSLVPGEHRFIGVRLPLLRELAKRIAKDDWHSYISEWSGEYFEDFMLRGFVISYAKMDTDERFGQFASFVPLIDNWSVCDSFCSTWKPKQKERERFLDFALGFLDTGEEFQMRYAIDVLMDHFICDEYIDMIIELMDRTHHDGYYLKMAVAWNLSVCFAKYPERTYAYLSGDNNLDSETLKMTAGKIRDSYRVSAEMKSKVRELVSRC